MRPYRWPVLVGAFGLLGLTGGATLGYAQDGPDTPSQAEPVAAQVVFDGTPDIPDELRRALNPYLNTRSASLANLSPDGVRMLITTRFAETNQIHEVTQPGGARRQLTFFDEPVRSPMYVPDAPALTYLADIGGTENYQLFRLELDSGVSSALTPAGARVRSYAWRDDGSAVAYSSNERNGTDVDIWVGDGRDASSARQLIGPGGYWNPFEFSADGEFLLVGKYVSVTESEVWVVAVDSGEMRRVSPADRVAAYNEVAFAADGRTVYLTSDFAGEFRALYRATEAGEFAPLSAEIPWDVEAFCVSADGRSLVFAYNAGGYSRLARRDTQTEIINNIEIPSGIVYGLQCAPDAAVVGFTFNGPTSTGDAYTVDLDDGRTQRWTESEIGGLDSAAFIEPTLVETSSFDGLEIPAFLYRPEGDGPFPVVISIHGGPESQARPYFSATTQVLVGQLGVAVLVPNVRGSAGYGKTYVSLDDGMLREDAVRDIGAWLDWIDASPSLDGERVAVVGGSYGGYMVLASLIHYPERIRAGVDMVGISNFVTFLENTAGYRRELRRAEYGDETDPTMRAHLLSISPTEGADRIRSALFVAQGANDPRVPASEAQQIVDAVRGAGGEVWYMLALDEGHGFARKENKDAYTLLQLMFLQRHLIDGFGD